ncbi:hypothetical protein ABEV34_11830 [Methylorubrum rhodesianum]|uniref:hypothetical protein n=1 Tax=Methylorubrum TaxID=2282523 RepID=UPI0016185347|nr:MULTISPECIES: hypothetical protein [Methylorubrum]MBB5765720.1 hypothetical protein [Methylorubrum rhodesianum]MBI1691512.1 hypothetical protein [Methylorubrum sp. DB1722]
MTDDGLFLRLLTGRGVPADARALGVLGGVLPGTPLIRRGRSTTVGTVLANAAQLGHTQVLDVDYQCVDEDVQVGIMTLTAPRVVSLPDVDDYPLGQDLVIADESGVCSDVRTITIQPGPDTGDIIGGADGATTIVLSSPYQAVRFRRGAANLWIRL